MNAEVKNRLKKPRTYYELKESQVSTPFSVVELYWKILKSYRTQGFSTVLDLGAGDARFCRSDLYQKYVGVEIDPEEAELAEKKINDRCQIVVDCAFQYPASNFDACIGNPPYVRHHDIESPWKEETAQYLASELNFKFNMHSNLFLYFIALGLLRTHDNGIVAMVIPYEWVSRPSYKGLRDLIAEQLWQVDIYCFEGAIFEGVLTTACITIIDKSKKAKNWQYYNINSDLNIYPRKGVTGTGLEVLGYSNRRSIWARRGLSPGSQKVFTLTEGQRIHYGLSMEDVLPCVTTFKSIPIDVQSLNKQSFKKYFIDNGMLCWLIKSNQDFKMSQALRAYLDNVPEEQRKTYTCLNQKPWYNFERFSIPGLLIHSGFTSFGPKVLMNEIGAVPIGSVMGVHSSKEVSFEALQSYLLSIDFESQLVAHSNNLKKIEIKQMNTVLNEWEDLYLN